jgi:hypothetical protein
MLSPDQILGGLAIVIVGALGCELVASRTRVASSFDELQGAARRVVLLLIPVGVSVTMVGVALAVKLLFGLGWDHRS